MKIELPDWVRLQKALSVEAERGYNNLVGKQYRFNEFIDLSLSQPPGQLKAADRKKWLQIAAEFSHYPELSFTEREKLVKNTQAFLLQMQQIITCKEGRRSSKGSTARSKEASAQNNSGTREQANGKLKVVNQKIATGESKLSIENEIKTKTKSLLPRDGGEKISLDRALSKVSAVGAKNGDRLALLGLYSVRDLLHHYPHNHIDYARQVKIEDLEAGQTVTIMGTVKRCNCFSSPRNKKLSILEVVLKDGTGQIKVSRFYAGYSSRRWQEQQKRQYPTGAVVAASGLVKSSKYGKTLDKPQLEVLDNSGGSIESMTVGRLLPVYPLKDGITADVIRRAIIAVLPAASQLKDPMPVGLLKKYGLIDLPEAIANIHFPTNANMLEEARRRLVFDEFFYLQLGLLHRRHAEKQSQSSAAFPTKGKLIDNFYKQLPFKLTKAQKRVINDILGDLEKPEPMNRLVQGDVGSGKTIVAVVAMLAAIQAGYQAALMAPTEVLAEQHYKKLVNWFNLLNLPVELLTGSTKTAKRRKIHAQLETGELPVLVGTHALIQDSVNFHKLGLIAIDEQHRFGVQQRARLQEKGIMGAPHVLTMTATPIPRTLALTLHGDLDVSQIDELPPGRKAIETTVISGKERDQAITLIRREVAQGRQAYVVLPLVEESEKLDLKSAIEEYQRLQDVIFPELRVGLLHGRLTSAEKEKAINEFRDVKTQILVSTTVVEVGVDVPNATVMLIENAERFGLSQLHQLRGRVGRGAERSYCLLMTNAKASNDARQRLQVMSQSQDGFLIAEMDMRLRGPGQVLGTRQSGLPDFALASLVEDREILILARDAAEKTIEKAPTLDRWPMLQIELEERYQRLMGGAIMT